MTAELRFPILVRGAEAIPSSTEMRAIVYDDARMLNVLGSDGTAVHLDTSVEYGGGTLKTSVARETTDDS